MTDEWPTPATIVDQAITPFDRAFMAYADCPHDRDAHTLAAARFFDVAYDDVTAEQRAYVKHWTFAARSEAVELGERIKARFSKVPWSMLTGRRPAPRTRDAVYMPARHGMSHAAHTQLFDIDYSALEISVMRRHEISCGYLYSEAQPDIALCTDYEVLSSPPLTFRVSSETIRANP